jgi:hypothetical protein
MVKNDVIQTYNVGKDAQPLDTVKRIKDILEQNGINRKIDSLTIYKIILS